MTQGELDWYIKSAARKIEHPTSTRKVDPEKVRIALGAEKMTSEQAKKYQELKKQTTEKKA